MPWQNDDPEKRRRDRQVYGSAEYKRNRAVTMRRADWRCEIRTEGICTFRATTCDHIVPVSAGGTHALSNLRAACGPCHRRKSAGEGGGYRNPRDPDHVRRMQWDDPEPRPFTAWLPMVT
jgi:5-methylcytosine-specific restriction endonuclease McrA